ncbi:unnamed protein product [Prorocentrum cordatum]|uniref:Uncharacterized protein n=1 Tax=Prorocentrum cordatum TaxID=2364126 RepID=A0ABN9UF96_9DINO|nr:unnamed protein product [Polarella glacialis]
MSFRLTILRHIAQMHSLGTCTKMRHGQGKQGSSTTRDGEKGDVKGGEGKEPGDAEKRGQEAVVKGKDASAATERPANRTSRRPSLVGSRLAAKRGLTPPHVTT